MKARTFWAGCVLAVACSIVAPLPAHANQQASSRTKAALSMDDEVQRLTDSVLIYMEKERSIVRAMREAHAKFGADSVDKIRRTYESQLRAVALQNMKLQTRLASLCDRSERPDGWMGISFSGDYRVVEQSPLTLRFVGYPRVEAVELNSPADKAGLLAGDSIVALDGNDLRGNVVSFASILRPGATLPATIKRDGKLRYVKMKIERRPSAMGSSRCGEMNMAVAAAMANPVIDVIRFEDGYVYTMTNRPPVAPRNPTPPSAAEPVVAPLPPRVWVSGTGSSSRVIAGAEVSLMDREALRETYGADHGVVVMRVLRGTPAEQSGLKAGDVVTWASGEKILTPIGLEKAIAEARSRDELKLTVVRKRKSQPLVLRWSSER
jgi:S1-C subfamily serine protease